jgi:hypothetical protein
VIQKRLDGYQDYGLEDPYSVFVFAMNAEIAKNDNYWALNNVRKFLQVYKERVERKEITGATIRNYVKSIKLSAK